MEKCKELVAHFDNTCEMKEPGVLVDDVRTTRPENTSGAPPRPRGHGLPGQTHKPQSAAVLLKHRPFA